MIPGFARRRATGLPVLALALATGFVLPSAPVRADENRVLKCNTGSARYRGRYEGPALVANVPRAMTPIDLNAVQMTDKAVTKSVVVEAVHARRTETQTLEVMTRIVNCTKQPLQIDARASFMDQNQVPTEAVSAWRRIYLPPLSTGVYQESSIGGPRVAHFLIELKSSAGNQYR